MKPLNLQDSFLNQVRTKRVTVSVSLSGGQHMQGLITGFDSFIILLDSNGRQNMIYKHAVVNIVPLQPVRLFRLPEAVEQNAEPAQDEAPLNEGAEYEPSY